MVFALPSGPFRVDVQLALERNDEGWSAGFGLPVAVSERPLNLVVMNQLHCRMSEAAPKVLRIKRDSGQ
jgi:hypothetical protein